MTLWLKIQKFQTISDYFKLMVNELLRQDLELPKNLIIVCYERGLIMIQLVGSVFTLTASS